MTRPAYGCLEWPDFSEASMGQAKGPPQASELEAPRGWQLFRSVDVQSEGWEYLLYSDSMLIGEEEGSVGPFRFFLTGAAVGSQPTGQLILRIRHAHPKPEPTGGEFPAVALKRRKWWLGLDPDEEIAALPSLALGIRLRSGGPVRRFRPTEDPAGVPHMYKHHAPGLVPVRHGRVQYPQVLDASYPLANGLNFLHKYRSLGAADAFVLAKAARQFADALWIADSDPEQAWLRLVTALEVVAVHVQTEEIDATQAFEDAYPAAAHSMKSLEGGADALPLIAKEFERLLGAGQRLRKFFKSTAQTHRKPGPKRCIKVTGHSSTAPSRRSITTGRMCCTRECHSLP
ncbi:hypothetical protein [Streptomyces sp. NPDC048419]|uniref:hypothetical protein n=1 Tax=Streptomyces sp. NPDC048419 TaxID=3365547 RepID=UPI0037157B9B